MEGGKEDLHSAVHNLIYDDYNQIKQIMVKEEHGGEIIKKLMD